MQPAPCVFIQRKSVARLDFMKSIRLSFVLLSFVLLFAVAPLSGLSQAASKTAGGKLPPTEAHPSASPLSPVESRIAEDRRRIQQTPDQFQPYNDLAAAMIIRSQETGNPSLDNEAEQALKTALRLAPDNMQVLKTRVVLLLARHQFTEARAEAKVLYDRFRDDVSLYGYMATADIELGHYEQAESEAQWMLDRLPNNVPGLLLGARLRELYGDTEGALQFLDRAYNQLPSSDTHGLVVIGEQVAGVEIRAGKIEDADRELQQTLQLNPLYPAGIEDLAEVRATQGKYEEAIELLRKYNQQWPRPQTLYALARVLARAGRQAQSEAAYANFERAALAHIETADNANRELVLYYADGNKPAEALSIARREVKTRQDVFTLDAYAWALYANGQYEEARSQIGKALKVGIRDARIFYHAALIASKQNDRSSAADYLKSLLQTNPSSEYAMQARKVLQPEGKGIFGGARHESESPSRSQRNKD